MAKQKRILALDVGTSSLKLGEFLVDKEGQLTLTNFGIASLGVDPHDEESRSAYIVATIQDIMAERGIAPAPTMVAVPGQSVFSRYVKLPPVEPDKLSQIVEYEAAQNVPFPIEEVVWDYQLIGQDAEEFDVLLVAMKQELIDDISHSISEAGLNTELVDVAPMTIANAYRYSYPEHEECALVLDMGARSTDLIFIEGDRIFNRSIPIAGNAITQQIMKEFDVSFDEAEQMKIEHGFVAFGGAYERPKDPMVDAISKCIRNIMTRMHAEINRSINFYCGQQNGSRPAHILLTGGTSAISHVDTFLREKLNLEVEYLNAFTHIELGDEVDEEELSAVGHVMSEVVGLGLRAAMPCAIEINLMPPEIIKQKKLRKKQPAFVAAAALLALSVLLAAGYQWLSTNKKTDHLKQVKQQVDSLKNIEGRVNAAQRQYAAITKDIEAMQTLHENRGLWPELMQAVAQSVPVKGLWITNLKALPEEKQESNDVRGRAPRGMAVGAEDTGPVKLATLQIDGLGYLDRLEFEKSRSHINNFAEQLKATGLFADKGIKYETPPTDGTDFVRSFRISATLKEPISQ